MKTFYMYLHGVTVSKKKLVLLDLNNVFDKYEFEKTDGNKKFSSSVVAQYDTDKNEVKFSVSFVNYTKGDKFSKAEGRKESSKKLENNQVITFNISLPEKYINTTPKLIKHIKAVIVGLLEDIYFTYNKKIDIAQ